MSTRGVSAPSDAPVSPPLGAAPPGYFDAASTEPLHPAARDVLLAAADEGWADPARLYGSARRARMLLDNAREIVAAVVGARPDEVTFTASGTQAIQLGMLGTVAARRRQGAGPRSVAVSAVEHSAVLQSAAHLARHEGTTTTEVGVGRDGRVDAAEFAAAVGDDTALACLQAANHEVGTVQPVDEVAGHCAARGVPLLVDAAQAAGRVPLPAGWSVLTASAHKWGGPAGVGVLAIRRDVRWRSPLPDDERGGGRVPGFENVPGALAAAAALRARWEEADAVAARQRELVDHIRARVPELLDDVDVVGHPTLRLPHLVTFSCLYLDGEALVTELDRAGFAISSGSSCTSSTLRPSHVLAAMGALTHGNVRVSLTRDATRADVDRFLAAVVDVVTRLRAGLEEL
ncbi:aminotransferase class V-fold PLP-dependent enzyme [Jiangella aurantiaca]|uniref:Aminotransferase class V-fold PLP-dependent enzyme n=1 Tax=Jiangella aurantiaca TaxID=2530373 RepID=A0A4R5A561_9ACTN|nr:aminotransferase class V-fold PLP-dependent enzyme [Jiangella aurantiaca]TDD66695.1 aminotransferase class V-fold PLP-dependent enzyme [Jiangella aurantiaca]